MEFVIMSITALLAILALIFAVLSIGEFYLRKTGFVLVAAVVFLAIAMVLETGAVHA